MKNSLNLILDEVEIPKFATVRQDLPAPRLDDVPGRILEQINTDRYRNLVKPGQTIGITAGSRGIANKPLVVATLVEWVKSLDARAVIIPAMGSHGGATAEGQKEMLLHLGFTPEVVGAEILSGLDVTSLGTVDGAEVLYSTDALNLDGMIVTNRIKAHTDISGPVESGLIKMAAIGLGKHRGALQAHSHGLANTGKFIVPIAEVMFERANILFGLGILENARDETRDVVAIPTDEIMVREPELLAESRQHLPRLLIHDIDVLIVDWMGKNISGDGMDPNVLGKSLVGVKNPDMNVNQIVSLDVTPESSGNATGIGLADITTKRLFDQIDYVAMYTNGLTSNGMEGSRIPPAMPNQKMAIQAGMRLSLVLDRPLRIVRIKNTLDVFEIEVSEALREEVEANPGLELCSQFADLKFDENGDLFPAAQ